MNRRNERRRMVPILAGWALLALAGTAVAGIGQGDAPLFTLNTVWAAGVEHDVPMADRLGGSYPNPFNPTTTIRYDLGARTGVRLKIYDLQGRLVRDLVDGEILEPGPHAAVWDGSDNRGQAVAAGVYLYRLETDHLVAARRMTMVK